MPTIITLGSASAKSLGFALSTSSSNYFISGITFNESIAYYEVDFAAYTLEVDASGNTTVFGYRGLSSTDAYVVRLVFDPTGTLTTKQAIYAASPAAANGPVIGSVTDSSGNVYISNCYLGGVSAYTPTITKYDSSGNRIAAYSFSWSPIASIGSRGGNLAIDNSGNIWQLVLGGPSNYMTKYAYCILTQYNSSLVKQAQYSISGSPSSATAPSVEFVAIDTATTNQIILAGSAATFTSPNYTNSSFIQRANITTPTTITGGVTTGSTTSTTGPYAGAIFLSAGVDSSNQVYTLQYNINTQIITLYKYNTAGTQVWGRQWSTPMNSSVYASAIKFDSLGNVYFTYLFTRPVSTSSGTVSVNNIGIAKFEGGGNLSFLRQLYCTNTSHSYNQAGTSVAISNFQNYVPSSTPSLKIQNGNMYISGVVDYYNSSDLSIPYMFLFKVPTDGTLTQSFSVGIYNMVYANYSPVVSVVTPPSTTAQYNPVSQSQVTSSRLPISTTITPTTLKRSL